jgi:CubicO group peptidase (beta-lactamase class C family)
MPRRKLGFALGAAFALLIVWGGRTLHNAAEVAVGYSAKQLCSGVFVSGLPAEFIIQHDIQPRMAILGPARPWLRMEVDRDSSEARAQLLLAEAVAGWQGARNGCTLHQPGLGPLPAAQLAAGALPPQQERAQRAREQAVAPPRSPAVEALLDVAFAEPRSDGDTAADGNGPRRRTLAVLIAHRGELLAERYAAPVTADTALQGWSMNKSLLATWVALRAAEGGLDPEASVAQQLSRLGAAEGLINAIDPGLTLSHLLQMESGLDFEERYGPGSDVTRMLYQSRTMWSVAPARGHAYPPGTHFSYSSGDTTLAAYLWQSSLGGQSYLDWLHQRFVEPLALQSLVAEADASGIQAASSYAYLRARDWLRVGQLWLDAWHARTPLLDQQWLRAAVTARKSDARGRYGQSFWLNTSGTAFPDAPHTLFYAGGNAGQYVAVLPEQELVIVRLGLTDPEVSAGMNTLIRELLAALEPKRTAWR